MEAFVCVPTPARRRNRLANVRSGRKVRFDYFWGGPLIDWKGKFDLIPIASTRAHKKVVSDPDRLSVKRLSMPEAAAQQKKPDRRALPPSWLSSPQSYRDISCTSSLGKNALVHLQSYRDISGPNRDLPAHVPRSTPGIPVPPAHSQSRPDHSQHLICDGAGTRRHRRKSSRAHFLTIPNYKSAKWTRGRGSKPVPPTAPRHGRWGPSSWADTYLVMPIY